MALVVLLAFCISLIGTAVDVSAEETDGVSPVPTDTVVPDAVSDTASEGALSDGEAGGEEPHDVPGPELSDPGVPVVVEDPQTPVPVPLPPALQASIMVYTFSSDALALQNIPDPENVLWESSDPNVVSVNSGTVEGVGKGEASVTAEYNGVLYTCRVTVTDPVLEPTFWAGNVDDTFSLTLKGARTALIKADNDTVSVSGDGKVTALRAGSTTISVIDMNGNVYTCAVSVSDTGRAISTVTARSIGNEELWLTVPITVGNELFQRCTGLKLVSTAADSYVVECRGVQFTVKKNQATKVIPAVTPTPAASVENKSFTVIPGVLVNLTHNLMFSGAPRGLVYLKNSDITPHFAYDKSCRLQSVVIKPLSDMVDDAYEAGITYFGCTESGAYRSFSLQDSYWNSRLSTTPDYGDDPYSGAGVKCVPAVSSEHRTGFAIDIQTTDAGYEWLKNNSYRYGFIRRYYGDKTKFTGVMDEYWHYTYVGVGIATTCFRENICLEEYYQRYVEPAWAVAAG